MLNSTMPRPRKDLDAILSRELRITPPDGHPITEWHIDDRIVKFVAFQEGGADTGKRLHYHCYIETTMTSQALPKWIYTVAKCKGGGNSVFFTRAPHDQTFGYIAKTGNCTFRHNYDQTHIEEWFTQSTQYRRQRETDRKRGQRDRADEIKQIKALVRQQLEDKTVAPYPPDIVSCFLDYCVQEDVRFPARTQMDQIIVELLYPFKPDLVRNYYSKTFSGI